MSLGATWNTYKKGGINIKVYPIILETEDLDEPKLIRVDVDDTVHTLKLKVGLLLKLEPTCLKLVLDSYSNEPRYLDNDDAPIKFDCSDKLYVATSLDEDPQKQFSQSKLRSVIDHFGYIISLNVVLPETDVGECFY